MRRRAAVLLLCVPRRNLDAVLKRLKQPSHALRRGDRPDRALEQAADHESRHETLRTARAFPSVEKVAAGAGRYGIASSHGRRSGSARTRGAAQSRKRSPISKACSRAFAPRCANLRASRIQPVINGTGILVHTNFGRAPLGPAVIEAVSRIGSRIQQSRIRTRRAAGAAVALRISNTISRCCAARKPPRS